MTWIFWAPAPVRMTSNSSFSSTSGAAAPPPAAGGGGDGHGGRGGDAELLLERVEELLQLEHGEPPIESRISSLVAMFCCSL